MTRKKRVGGKMDTHFVGPYVITKCLGEGIYSLRELLIQVKSLRKLVEHTFNNPYKDNSILNNTHACVSSKMTH